MTRRLPLILAAVAAVAACVALAFALELTWRAVEAAAASDRYHYGEVVGVLLPLALLLVYPIMSLLRPRPPMPRPVTSTARRTGVAAACGGRAPRTYRGRGAPTYTGRACARPNVAGPGRATPQTLGQVRSPHTTFTPGRAPVPAADVVVLPGRSAAGTTLTLPRIH